MSGTAQRKGYGFSLGDMRFTIALKNLKGREAMAKKDGKKGKDKAKKKSGKTKAASVVEEVAALEDAGTLVTQVSRSFRTLISRELNDTGLYAGQEGVILALAEQDGLTAGAIAEQNGVKPPTMTRTIVRMEAQGFVERRDDEDGRLTTVWLTEKGRQTLQRIQEVKAQVQTLALAGLSEKKKRQLAEYLNVVDGNLGSALDGC